MAALREPHHVRANGVRRRNQMSRLLVHIATGPENPTRVALGLLVARSALEAGHDVDLFVAGDGVAVLRPETLDAGSGIGTGSLREHVEALVAGGATFYVSGLSSKARGLDAEALGGLVVTMAPPSRLVALAFEADRVISY
jgi:predicted peroxiredoxin